MSVNNETAGTGQTTASQAAPASAPATQPGQAAQQEQQEQQIQNVLPQGETSPAGQAKPPAEKGQGADPIDALKPQLPENAPKAEEGGKGKDAPPAEEKPLEIKLPEGFQKDDALMGSFLDVAKEGGIKQETAQKLFDMYAAEQQKAGAAYEKAIIDQRTRINAEWARQCQSDPEFGGANYGKSCNHLTAAIRRFVPPAEQAEFVDFYSRCNLQNAPHMFRFLARVGMATSEAGPVASDASNPAREQSLADKLFSHLPSSRK